MIIDDNIIKVQFTPRCSTCGAANIVLSCPTCGRLVNAADEVCYNCGLALEKPADSEWAPALDRIVLDYNGRPLVSGINNVMEYLAVMVRKVLDRSLQAGMTMIPFEFRMSPDMWDAISGLYTIHQIGIYRDEIRAKLVASQLIIVDGVDYPVELDESCGNDVLFVPREEKRDLSPNSSLSAALRNVGS